MMYGQIKWFSERLGYGFILGDDGRDYFAHYKDFPGGHTHGLELVSGDRVCFEAREDGKGIRAINIQMVVEG